MYFEKSEQMSILPLYISLWVIEEVTYGFPAVGRIIGEPSTLQTFQILNASLCLLKLHFKSPIWTIRQTQVGILELRSYVCPSLLQPKLWRIVLAFVTQTALSGQSHIGIWSLEYFNFTKSTFLQALECLWPHEGYQWKCFIAYNTLWMECCVHIVWRTTSR